MKIASPLLRAPARRLKALARRYLSRPWLLPYFGAPVLGALLGCSEPPSTFQQVLDGQIAMATADRDALQELLRSQNLAPRDLAVLSDDAAGSAGSWVRLQGERVVSLRLARSPGSTGSPREPWGSDVLTALSALQEMEVEGSPEAFSLRGHEALERLILINLENTLRSLHLEDLKALSTLVVNGGDLQAGLRLEGLPALQELALQRCGLRRLPPLNDFPLTSLELAGNQIRDFAPLAQLPNLARLQLSDNGLTSLETLPPLPALRTLRLGHNPLSPTVQLRPGDYPQLATLDLRFTGLQRVPEGLQGLPVQWDEDTARRLDFQATLERLRASYASASGDLVTSLGASGGTLTNTDGECRWQTSTFHRAQVRCQFRFASLQGLAAARLGTTDLTLPFQGGGSPRIRAELRVGTGAAALYVRESFDLVALARQLSEADEATGEQARLPEDHFEGYRRLVATPGSPAILEGEPSLLGSRVVLWLRAEGSAAESLTLTVEPG